MSDSKSYRATLMRLFVGTMAPAPIGLVCLFTVLGGLKLLQTGTFHTSVPSLNTLFELVLLSYIGVGVQSMIYALIMEYLINRHIKSTEAVLVISAVLGLLASSPLMLAFWGGREAVAFGLTGLLVGLACGAVSRYFFSSSRFANLSYLKNTHKPHINHILT